MIYLLHIVTLYNRVSGFFKCQLSLKLATLIFSRGYQLVFVWWEILCYSVSVLRGKIIYFPVHDRPHLYRCEGTVRFWGIMTLFHVKNKLAQSISCNLTKYALYHHFHIVERLWVDLQFHPSINVKHKREIFDLWFCSKCKYFRGCFLFLIFILYVVRTDVWEYNCIGKVLFVTNKLVRIVPSRSFIMISDCFILPSKNIYNSNICIVFDTQIKVFKWAILSKLCWERETSTGLIAYYFVYFYLIIVVISLSNLYWFYNVNARVHFTLLFQDEHLLDWSNLDALESINHFRK